MSEVVDEIRDFGHFLFYNGLLCDILKIVFLWRQNVSVQTKENPLGYEKISTLLGRFGIPSIVAMLVSSLYNIIDQIFIGQGVGYLGNAATNVSFPFSTVCLAIALLIGVGSASKFSLELGRGNKESAAECVGNAVWMISVSGIVYLALSLTFLEPLLKAFGATENILPYAKDYMSIIAVGMPFLIFTNAICNLIRADGSPKYSMACMLVGAIINTVLDPIFIFVLDMGVKGAAYATVISQFASFVMAFFYMWQFKQIKLAQKCFELRIRDCVGQASLGLSNSLNQLAITLVQIVMNNSLSYYGARSIYGEDIPLSACGIVMKVNAIMISFFVGLSQGSQPIIGFNYGARKYDRVKKVYKLAVSWNFVVSVIGFIAFQFFPKQIISLFGSGEALYFEFAVKFMRTYLFMMLVNGVQTISSNLFAAIGKPLKGVVLSMSRQVFFLIPLLLIFPVFWGIEGLLFAAPVADAFALLISILMIFKEFKRMNSLKMAENNGKDGI